MDSSMKDELLAWEVSKERSTVTIPLGYFMGDFKGKNQDFEVVGTFGRFKDL